MAHDVVIRGGLIVDGTGSEPFKGMLQLMAIPSPLSELSRARGPKRSMRRASPLRPALLIFTPTLMHKLVGIRR